ncbi:MAG: lysostaphin resistance A-like protein [Sarcina sp.]
MKKIIEEVKSYKEHINLIIILQVFMFSFVVFVLSVGYDPVEFAVTMPPDKSFLEKFRVIVITPILEELIFRAGLYKGLSKVISRRKAVIISSLLFAMMHGVLRIPDSFFAGMLFCEVYIRGAKIYYPMMLHGFANTLGVVFWYIEFNHIGGILPYPMIGFIFFVIMGFVFYRAIKKSKSKRGLVYEKVV